MSDIEAYKVCRSGHHNPLTAMECVACDSRSLEIVYPASADEGRVPCMPRRSPAHDGPASAGMRTPSSGGEETSPCECPKPDRTKPICPACGGVVVREPSPPPAEPRFDSPSASLFRPSVRLQNLPALLIGSGISIGRAVPEMPSPVANTLREFRGVSRLHAWIGCNEDSVLIVDRGSKNGTWIDGRRLTAHQYHSIPRAELPRTIWLGGKLVLNIEAEGKA